MLQPPSMVWLSFSSQPKPPPTEPNPSAPRLSRKPPVAPLPLTAAALPSLLSLGRHSWVPCTADAQDQKPSSSGRELPQATVRGGAGCLSTLYCPHRHKILLRTGFQGKPGPRRPLEVSPAALPPLPEEGRPDVILRLGHTALAARVVRPRRSQRGPWHDRKISAVVSVSSPAPIPQVPAAPTLLGRFLFSQNGRMGKSPAQKGSSPVVPFSCPCPLPKMPVALELADYRNSEEG